MRGKKLNSNTKLKKFYNDPLKCPRGIYTRDKNDVKNCDLMIVNFLGSKTVSIGTCVEYGWADSFSKPVITIMEKEKNIHNHPFIQEISGFLVETLDEAIAIAKFILKP